MEIVFDRFLYFFSDVRVVVFLSGGVDADAAVDRRRGNRRAAAVQYPFEMTLAAVARRELQARGVESAIHPGRGHSRLCRWRQRYMHAAVDDAERDVARAERVELGADSAVPASRLETARDLV